jgi:hypothetical protein
MATGFWLGVISFMSLVLSFMNLPPFMRRWLVKHRLITDLAAGALVFFLLSSISKSLGAVIGSMLCGLFVNFGLKYAGWVDKNQQRWDYFIIRWHALLFDKPRYDRMVKKQNYTS